MITEDEIMAYDHDPAYDPVVANQLRETWWDERGASAWAQRKPHMNRRDPDRRLRVGYVSGDLKFHSAAMAFGAVILRHSDAVTPLCYNTAPSSERDQTTDYFKETFGAHFVDVSGYSSSALAQIIRTDKIDILIDLSGLTPFHRFETFAEKPAPIQLHGWGYVTDHPWPCFDGVLADRFVAPTDARTTMQARIIDLPSILTNLLRPDVAGVGVQPCLSQSPTFGVFQRAQKFNAETCRVWSEILRRVSDAVLVIKSSQEPQDFHRDVFELFAPDVRTRVQYEAPNGHVEHLRRHAAVDLMLDTWPQSGGCSSLESLWMGVPILTMVSDRMIQRTTGSFLHTLGLDLLITQSEEEYVAVAALAVTQWKEKLASIRSTLRARLGRSRIINGYVEAVEAVYRNLWRAYCANVVKEAA